MKKVIIFILTTIAAVGLIFSFYLNSQHSLSEVESVQYSDITLVLVNNYQPDTLISLQTKLQNSFPGVAVGISKSPLMLPTELINQERQQYDSTDVLSYIDQSFPDRPSTEIVVGVIEDEIYSGNLNIAFSSGDAINKVVIISTAYFGREIQVPDGRGSDFDFTTHFDEVLNDRAHKTALRMIGGMAGLQSSSRAGSSCAMSFSNTLSELDEKSIDWCGDNRELLKAARLLD